MKSFKNILAISLIFILTFSFAACSKVQPLDFSYEEMTITLNDTFSETNSEGYTVCYDSKNIAVLALKEKFDYMEGFENFTLEQYRNLVSSANTSLEITPLEIDGMYCMEHSFFNADVEAEYTYLSVTYKSDEAFWLIQFACLSEKYDSLKPDFINWAKSVRFN